MVGIDLTNQDLEAIKKIYIVKYSVEISNWKERDMDTCMWIVRCPDTQGNWVTKTGESLAKTIYAMLLDTKESI